MRGAVAAVDQGPRPASGLESVEHDLRPDPNATRCLSTRRHRVCRRPRSTAHPLGTGPSRSGDQARGRWGPLDPGARANLGDRIEELGIADWEFGLGIWWKAQRRERRDHGGLKEARGASIPEFLGRGLQIQSPTCNGECVVTVAGFPTGSRVSAGDTPLELIETSLGDGPDSLV